MQHLSCAWYTLQQLHIKFYLQKFPSEICLHRNRSTDDWRRAGHGLKSLSALHTNSLHTQLLTDFLQVSRKFIPHLYCVPKTIKCTECSLDNKCFNNPQKHTHTHTHPLNGPFSGTTRVSRYQKGKTNLDFTEARDSEWQWHQLGHVQACTSL